MITTQIHSTRRSPTNVCTVLAAVAPNGAILSRRWLGSTLTRDQIAVRAADFAAFWAAKIYRPLRPDCRPIVDRCPEVLL